MPIRDNNFVNLYVKTRTATGLIAAYMRACGFAGWTSFWRTIYVLPATSQSTQNRKHTLRVSGFDSTANGVNSNAFSVNVGFASLTSVTNVTSGNLFGVSSVSANGSNLDIVLSSTITSPFVKFELFCEIYTLVQIDSVTIV